MTTKLGKAAQPRTAVNFAVPADACDCHTHIHGDPARFPFYAGRVYTPEPALPEEMAALHEALHIRRVVIVTPGVYGTDNSSTLYGMIARGVDARGVAVIDAKTAEADLDAMGKAGIGFIERLPGFEGYLISADRIATMTSGFSRYTTP